MALKNIAAEVNGERSVPAFASALMWIGSGIGGILMGRVAEAVGVRWTVICGAIMTAAGLALSTLGPYWPLYIGHGVFIGLIGIGGINAPLLRLCEPLVRPPPRLGLGADFKRRLSRRRDLAAGIRAADRLCRLAADHAVLRGLRAHPHRACGGTGSKRAAGCAASLSLMHAQRAKTSVMGWPPNLVFALQMCAIFTCCMPMSMPQAHLVALCTDHGISAATGAAMVSVLLGSAFFSRQVWGVISDRIGGLYTMLIGSGCQAFGMLAFLLTQSEIGLFTVAALFGLRL